MKEIIRAISRQGPMLAAAALSLSAVALIAPEQIGVIMLKVSIVTAFAALGYYVDRAAFPYARPHMLLAERKTLPRDEDRIEAAEAFRAAMIRRAIVIGAVVLAGSLAL